jgi:predicted RNA-binding protein Jag
MSEVDIGAGKAPEPQSPSAPDNGKREQAVRVLSEILQKMDIPAELDVKDGPDGGISIGIKLQGEPPGSQPGRRSHVTDALQFLANKIVNRPGTERRWISLGIGGHPEPRPKVERGKKPAPAPTPQSSARPASAKPTIKNGIDAGGEPTPDVEDTAPDVTPDPALAQAIRELAQRSSRLGRFYAIAAMSKEDRARTLEAAKGIPGVKVTAQGEGRNRRLVFTPEKPAPLPKKTAQLYDDEDGLE